MEDFGELTGNLIIFLFILEAFRFLLKRVFVHFGKWIKTNTKLHPLLLKAMKLNGIFHPYVGYLILALIVVHAYIQTSGFAFLSTTGLIAAGFMSAEVLVGFVGTYLMKKPRPAYWIWVHRLIPVFTLIAILIHKD
jgi:hypothetical protein